MRISRTIAFVLILAGPLFFATPSFASRQTFDRSFPLNSGGTLVLQNVNGSVEVDGWERDKVEIHAVKTSRSNPSDLDKVGIDVDVEVNKITVHTSYPQGNGVEVAVEYQIRVPYHVELEEVGTVNGDIRVSGVAGSGDLRAVNGNVEVLDSSGRFSARTTNGDVRLELIELTGGMPITLASVNGSVILALPGGASADLIVRNMNGDFHSDWPLHAIGAFSPQVFRGRLGAGGGKIVLSTVNGGIRVIQTRPGI